MITLKWTRKKKTINRKWSRRYINKSISRIRQIFSWAKSHDLITTKGLVSELRELEPSLAGRTEAVELPARTAVPDEHIEAVRKVVRQRTRDIIDLCLLTGCRPGELVSLTTGMINRSEDVWVAELAKHKTQHHGKVRVLAFGPKTKLILWKYLLSHPDKRIFPIRRDTFSKTIVYWCAKLGLPKFTGHWLTAAIHSWTVNRFPALQRTPSSLICCSSGVSFGPTLISSFRALGGRRFYGCTQLAQDIAADARKEGNHFSLTIDHHGSWDA